MSDIEANYFRRGLIGIFIILIVLVVTLGCAKIQLSDNLTYLEKEKVEIKIEVRPNIEKDVEHDRSLAVKVEGKISVEEVMETMIKIQNPEPSTEAIMLARLVRGEAGGIWSLTEQACVMWTVLNRVDAGYGDTIAEVITAPGQYYYIPSLGTIDGYGRDLVWLAQDVISRWEREKAGEVDVGRVLPSEYLWFSGDGQHNHFRNNFSKNITYWDYSLPSPYES